MPDNGRDLEIEWMNYKSLQGTFEGDGYIKYLDYDDCCMSVYLCQNFSNGTLFSILIITC